MPASKITHRLYRTMGLFLTAKTLFVRQICAKCENFLTTEGAKQAQSYQSCSLYSLRLLCVFLRLKFWLRLRCVTKFRKIATYCLLATSFVLFLTACGENSAAPSGVPAAEDGDRLFKETGLTVQNEFLHFFDIYGGIESLGQPISGEMADGGWRVQYFEKGRLEFHPENEPEYRVTVGWLGDLLNRRRPPIPPDSIPPANANARRYYEKTGHTLNGDFLRYFDSHGGSVRFGLPISEPFLLEGRLAQDFQSARFFWTPEADPPVIPEKIGRVYFERIEERE